MAEQRTRACRIAGAIPVIYKDDRTDAERETLTVLVGGRDSFMSGWGGPTGAEDGSSYAYWACRPDDVFTVSEWVEARDEITLVPIDDVMSKEQSEHEHVHVYAVREGHVSLCQA